MKSYYINSFNEKASDFVCSGINEINDKRKTPVLICIGSDLVLGDSLGPLCGTLLRKKNISNYIYGTLNAPITAKEVSYAKSYLKEIHKNTVGIAIDAAIGEKEDVGLIKIVESGLKPGLGVNKNLGVIGDISIIGIVATKSQDNFNLYNLTRLNLIYKMAETIADGIEQYIYKFTRNEYVS